MSSPGGLRVLCDKFGAWAEQAGFLKPPLRDLILGLFLKAVSTTEVGPLAGLLIYFVLQFSISMRRRPYIGWYCLISIDFEKQYPPDESCIVVASPVECTVGKKNRKTYG
jgi:hypothetical protein